MSVKLLSGASASMATESESSSLESDNGSSTDLDNHDQSVEELEDDVAPESLSDHDQAVQNKIDLTHKSLYKYKRFSSSIVTALNHYYNNGMSGIGKHYDCLISCAARETKLTVLQVNVCSYC